MSLEVLANQITSPESSTTWEVRNQIKPSYRSIFGALDENVAGIQGKARNGEEVNARAKGERTFSRFSEATGVFLPFSYSI
jgi:hypothetical protein